MNIPDLIDREQLPWSLLQKGWASPNDAQHEQAMQFADALNDLHRKRVTEALAACKPQLRPIAEMPAEVPDGYERRFWRQEPSSRWSSSALSHACTHFIDIALPVEDYPADFEQAFVESKLDAKDKAAAFKLWKGGAK